MNIILLTQDDPFYLAESTKDLIEKIDKTDEHRIIHVIITKPSVFGRQESVINKIFKTWSIFGACFFLHYSYKYFVRRVLLRKSVFSVVNKSGIPVRILESSINSSDNVDFLLSLSPDVILIIAGNQIIKKQVLDIPKFGVVNAHSSLLPLYKGLMPSFWVMKNEESQTGVTLYKLTEGIDNGPIISQRRFDISEKMSQADIIVQSKILANDLIVETLCDLENTKIHMVNDGGSYFKFPTKDDVRDFYRKGKRFY